MEIGDGANQPRSFTFPKRKFGIKNPIECSFQPSCFEKWPWLHYNEENDSAYCYVCIKAMKKENKKSGEYGCFLHL